MADKFDPYREAQVIETATNWPEELAVDPQQQAQLEALLHAEPEQATHLEYVRMHTGFRREITVTPEDLERLASHNS